MSILSTCIDRQDAIASRLALTRLSVALFAKAAELSPHVRNRPAKVGKPDFATDNAQFFHLRIDAPPLCG
jgi:hypothetical protein